MACLREIRDAKAGREKDQHRVPIELRRDEGDEEHDTNPASFYGFTKLDIERLMAWYDQLKGLKFTALRYFNAAGYDVQGRITGLEHDTSNLIPSLVS